MHILVVPVQVYMCFSSLKTKKKCHVEIALIYRVVLLLIRLDKRLSNKLMLSVRWGERGSIHI